MCFSRSSSWPSPPPFVSGRLSRRSRPGLKPLLWLISPPLCWGAKVPHAGAYVSKRKIATRSSSSLRRPTAFSTSPNSRSYLACAFVAFLPLWGLVTTSFAVLASCLTLLLDELPLDQNIRRKIFTDGTQS